MSTNRKLHTIRTSYLYQAKHLNDSFLNLGYKYKGKIIENGTSPELRANPLQIPMINTLEVMLNFILENAKTVKKWFAIAIDKNSTNVI